MIIYKHPKALQPGESMIYVNQYIYIVTYFGQPDKAKWEIYRTDVEAIDNENRIYESGDVTLLSKTGTIFASIRNMYGRNMTMVDLVQIYPTGSEKQDIHKCTCPDDNFRWNGVGCKCGGK